jgi:hypothetical protein
MDNITTLLDKLHIRKDSHDDIFGMIKHFNKVTIHDEDDNETDLDEIKSHIIVKPSKRIRTTNSNKMTLSDNDINEILKGVEKISIEDNKVILEHSCGIKFIFPLAINCGIDYTKANPTIVPIWIESF